MAPKPQFRLSVDGVITLQAKCLNGTCAIVYTYQPYGPQFEPLARVVLSGLRVNLGLYKTQEKLLRVDKAEERDTRRLRKKRNKLDESREGKRIR
ncbi:uncharacterized [Tachysurus ichikawai]